MESAIEGLKKAIEKNDVAEMKRGMESLNAAQHKIAEAMYRGAQQPAGGAGGDAQSGDVGGGQPSGSAAGDVIDAEVVEEEKK